MNNLNKIITLALVVTCNMFNVNATPQQDICYGKTYYTNDNIMMTKKVPVFSKESDIPEDWNIYDSYIVLPNNKSSANNNVKKNELNKNKQVKQNNNIKNNDKNIESEWCDLSEEAKPYLKLQTIEDMQKNQNNDVKKDINYGKTYYTKDNIMMTKKVPVFNKESDIPEDWNIYDSYIVLPNNKNSTNNNVKKNELNKNKQVKQNNNIKNNDKNIESEWCDLSEGAKPYLKLQTIEDTQKNQNNGVKKDINTNNTIRKMKAKQNKKQDINSVLYGKENNNGMNSDKSTTKEENNKNQNTTSKEQIQNEQMKQVDKENILRLKNNFKEQYSEISKELNKYSASLNEIGNPKLNKEQHILYNSDEKKIMTIVGKMSEIMQNVMKYFDFKLLEKQSFKSFFDFKEEFSTNLVAVYSDLKEKIIETKDFNRLKDFVKKREHFFKYLEKCGISFKTNQKYAFIFSMNFVQSVKYLINKTEKLYKHLTEMDSCFCAEYKNLVKESKKNK